MMESIISSNCFLFQKVVSMGSSDTDGEKPDIGMNLD